MTSVSFGDRPAGNIATAALRKTAEVGQKISSVPVENFGKWDIC